MTRSLSSSRTRRSPLLAALGLTAALVLGGTACGSDDQANAILKSAGVDANVSTGGDLPDGFPGEVPTPDLDLETGAAAVGTFTLRYTSKDAHADAAAYQKALEAKGFTISNPFDFDEASGDYVGFTADGSGQQVIASAYGPKAPGGGNYMAVVVTPAAG